MTPAVWIDVGDFTLLVFTQDGVPTWEVRRRAKASSKNDNDLVVDGTADTFDAAKAAALFEASERSETEDIVSLNPVQKVQCRA